MNPQSFFRLWGFFLSKNLAVSEFFIYYAHSFTREGRRSSETSALIQGMLTKVKVVKKFGGLKNFLYLCVVTQ